MTEPAHHERNEAGLRFAEFVAMMAAILALNALAIDVMLPALPNIADTFDVTDENDRQAIIPAYLIGFGIAQFFFGPITDRFGRRPVLLAGLAVYALAGVAAIFAPAFEALLAARFIQGVACAGPRVVANAIIRDCYEGRTMARVLSLAMVVFMAVPVIAPALGQVILLLTGSWRVIFVVLVLCGVAMVIWCGFRLGETWPKERRRPLNPSEIARAYWVSLTTRVTLGYTLAGGVSLGGFFAFLYMAQQIFVDVYDMGALFPIIFAIMAIGIACSSFANASLVERMGMRRLSHGALFVLATTGLVTTLVSLSGTPPLWLFSAIQFVALFQIGMLMGNFTALAMEPHGKNAGTASSVIGAVTTTMGAVIGALIGQTFNGTPMPLGVGFLVTGVISILIVLVTERGKLFQVVHKSPR